MKGRVMAIELEIKDDVNILESAMFQALEGMKSAQDVIKISGVGGLAFNFKKNNQLIIQLVYEADKIAKMDFDNVSLKKFIDDAYRFKASSLLAKEVNELHKQVRNEV